MFDMDILLKCIEEGGMMKSVKGCTNILRPKKPQALSIVIPLGWWNIEL